MTVPEAPMHAELDPKEAWSRRLLRIGGFIQLAFAAFWLVRGGLDISGDVGVALAVVFGVAAIAVPVYGVRRTAGTRPADRSRGDAYRAIGGCRNRQRAQSSVVLPVIVIATGHRDWVLPSIAIHDRADDALVQPPRAHSRYRAVGWALTVGPILLVATLSGSTRAATPPSPPDCCSWDRRRRLPRPRRRSSARFESRAARHTGPVITTMLGDHMSFRPFFNPRNRRVDRVHGRRRGQQRRARALQVAQRAWWRHHGAHPSSSGGALHHHDGKRASHSTARSTWPERARPSSCPGAPHSEGNTGTVEIEGMVELRPGLRTKEWHEALAGLVVDGKTTLRGAPKNPLQLGATFWHFRHESRATSPPIWVQDRVLPALWALAKAAAYAPTTSTGTAMFVNGPGSARHRPRHLP